MGRTTRRVFAILVGLFSFWLGWQIEQWTRPRAKPIAPGAPPPRVTDVRQVI